tara:strand:+ start:1324 stop:2322 length:999 start_codon:yes stop_codon:yes gene_type:complete
MTKGKFQNDKAFGVELEFSRPANVSKERIAELLRLRDVVTYVEGYNHNTSTYWKIVPDCTVRATNNSQLGRNEMVSPKLYGQDGKRQLKTVLKLMNDLGCTVNISCGTHVHHDVTAEMMISKEYETSFLNRLIKTVLKYENIIYRLISPSRLMRVGNGWWTIPARAIFAGGRGFDMSAKWIAKRVLKNLKSEVDHKYRRPNATHRLRKTQNTRYCGLNLRNIWTRGSVEFRYHQGTLNFNKLWAWIVLTQAIVNSARDSKTVKFTTVQSNEHGLFHFRRAIGFIGQDQQCEETAFANKEILKRFKAMNTQGKELRRATSRYYSEIVNNVGSN